VASYSRHCETEPSARESIRSGDNVPARRSPTKTKPCIFIGRHMPSTSALANSSAVSPNTCSGPINHQPAATTARSPADAGGRGS
jgi:hypothetical protein